MPYGLLMFNTRFYPYRISVTCISWSDPCLLATGAFLFCSFCGFMISIGVELTPNWDEKKTHDVFNLWISPLVSSPASLQ